ncbi:hypothetical protein N665_0038s0015 [Sinapis alba]|nr:hypothetical protein N665_0038s0015 [Sinapis alba]
MSVPINATVSQAGNVMGELVFDRLDPLRRGLFTWTEILSRIRGPQSSPSIILRRITSQAMVFHLSKQHNNVIHNQISLSTDEVLWFIDRYIRIIISAKRKQKNCTSLMSLWLR